MSSNSEDGKQEGEGQNSYKAKKKTIKKNSIVSLHLSTITLNVNPLNSPTKGLEWLNG